ncbi:hypothetical protein OSB04_028416 [Centaurea solstitialis]|uniref:TIR domain-containing protein n=1 Tax=Centaurea solstitialis TaxID=347529 RepID=A0AA38W7P8_9ASTR|nr:hypothetical protein OSB04_028416 [Centaurea solstitialis]
MASSSSSFHSTPSSSSQFWTHHVFMSFRGTDTRNTFVDHLYSALDQRGIHTYKDDETLPRGETIGPSLFKAIEESQIALIVFSENYADSSWCLQELAHIMKCKDERGLIVMPIFYHINPSELRKQKGKYGKALAKHKLEKKNVDSWRKALVDAGNLSGDVANRSTRETMFINKIVDTISRLCVAISSDNQGLVGIETRLHDLKSKRGMESEGVVMVGIWGFGGGGKTTLASSLYDEISSKFDFSCFVENIREESSKFGLPKLQKDLLSLVLNQTQINRVEDGKRLIKDRFCRKKVLIILDDVDDLDQLKALAGSHNWFGEGSRIISTTRDMHLLTSHKVNVIYNISLLNDKEAMKLFLKHAPQHDRPVEDYEKLSKEVVSYAGGLTLALKVLGSFLCDKDISEYSYCFFNYIWDEGKLDVLPNLKGLNLSYSRKLISTPDFKGLPCLERLTLHGCANLKEIHSSIGCHKTLIFLDLNRCESLKIFPPIIRMRKLETLILSDQFRKFPEIQTSMDNLKKLCLERSGIEVVPSSIGEYCTNLHSLDLRECKYLQSIEGNFHLLKHLKRLHLNDCDQLKNIPAEGLFDIECCLQLLSSIKNLHQGIVNLKLFGFSTSLRKLRLRGCILVDGDISSVFCQELPNLQALDLSGNDFSRLHSSLLQLPRLKYLNVSSCDNLVELPDLPSSMSILIAQGCNSLDVTGDFPTNLEWLWKVLLSAKKCNVEHVLQSMLQGNAIEDYYISIRLDGPYIPIRGFANQISTLQLPWNWNTKFSGFLVYVDRWVMLGGDVITIEEVISGENRGDILEVSNEEEESKKMSGRYYISFSSLKETSWWNSTHTTISFSLSSALTKQKVCLRVDLLPKRSQGDGSIEWPKDPTYHSEFWDEEFLNSKTFEIIHDSKSCIKIQHEDMYCDDLFDRI